MSDFVPWLRELADKGGKGVVNAVDARSLGRIADELMRLRAAAPLKHTDLNAQKATAVKRGRNPRWPYVPVVDHGTRTEQIRAKAFATREEAVSYAAAVIEHRAASVIERMKEPRHRALREQHGQPKELKSGRRYGNEI